MIVHPAKLAVHWRNRHQRNSTSPHDQTREVPRAYLRRSRPSGGGVFRCHLELLQSFERCLSLGIGWVESDGDPILFDRFLLHASDLICHG